MKHNTLVFLSGWATDKRFWFNQEEYFSSYNKIHISYYRNVHNHYLTDLGETSYSKVALELIKEQEGPVILVGWSLGAMVALQLAVLAPEKLQGMILVGGTARFVNEAGYNAGLPQVIVDKMKKKLLKNHERTLKDFYMLMFTQEERKQGAADKFMQQLSILATDWSSNELQAGLDYLKNCDFRNHLENIKTPTLIIHGEKDEICPFQAGEYLNKNIKGSKIKILPGCGHVPFISRAGDFDKEVEGWIHGLYR